MKMLLNVPQRTALLKLLPQQGNFMTMKIVQELAETIMLTPDELKRFEFVFDKEEDLFKWNDAGRDEPIELDITDAAHGVICETLKALDKNGALFVDAVPLYERFMQRAD